MSKDKLADELVALRLQITQLKTRAAQIEIAMKALPKVDRDLRPGWPIRRLTTCAEGAHAR